MRLDKSLNLPLIRLDRSHDPIISKIDLGISSNIRLVYKLVKSLTETNIKIYEPKNYNEVINNLIDGNR